MSRTVESRREPFRADLQLPGDKSLSHRALLFAAMAEGTSEITNLGSGEDVGAMAKALGQLGVVTEGDRLFSPGVEAWHEPEGPIDCRNSGTALRTLAGALSAQPRAVTLTGDRSLRARPMRRLVAPLTALGARIALAAGDVPPVTVGPPQSPLRGAEVSIAIPSAQVRTATELAAVQAEGESQIISPPGWRDHTERWLATMGLGERVSEREFRVYPGRISPYRYEIPGDVSSAAFLWAAAAINPGSVVTTRDVTLNAGRIGFLEILGTMGAGIDAEVTRSLLGDPVGDVTVRGSGLTAVEISGPLTVAALDELPLVAVVASFAEGISVVRDAAELRVKESDRIATTCAMIRELGGGAEATDDGFRVLGIGWLEAGRVESDGDHRIAMAAAVAATGGRGSVEIVGAEAAAVSWPDFYDTLEHLWS